MGDIIFSYDTSGKEASVVAECQTNLLGAGFHKAAIELTDELADLNGMPFEVEDETEYYDHRDFERMRSEHFYNWLTRIVNLFREQIGDECQTLAICWDYNKYTPQEIDGTIVSPFGRIHLKHFLERFDNEGIEALAAEFFMWNNEERDALFYRNSALSALWEDCYFMPSERSEEDNEINAFILDNLEKAAGMDATLPFPKEDYLLLCRLSRRQPVDVSSFPDFVCEYPIGYRKGDITCRLGNLSFTLPGNMIYFDEDDSHGYYNPVDENWQIVRRTAVSVSEDEIEYLEENGNETLVKEIEFTNGKCKLFYLADEENEADEADDGDSEYVYQSQVITDYQFSLFTISCGNKVEGEAFSIRLIESFMASKEGKFDKLLKQIEQWDVDGEEQKIVDAILEIAEEERTPELVGLLARAYINLDEYSTALEYLFSIEEECREDAVWFFRLGYAYYYLNKIDEAQKAFERSQELNPGDEDTEEFLERCLEKKSPYNPEVYDDEQLDALEDHLDKYFGESDNVFHEIASPDIHVDIFIVEPAPERNYYTLVTCGMGAHRMNVPEELAEYKLERAELLICLPADWDINNKDEKYYWPLRWLKILARLPIEHDTWLAWGHTVPNNAPFAENTQLSGVLLVNPENVEEGAAVCKLPGGDEVNIYQVIPLYDEEMNFKVLNSADELLEKLDIISAVVDVNRVNVCKDSSF